MKTGLVLPYGQTFLSEALWCLENGIPTCQLHVNQADMNDAAASDIADVIRQTGIEITAVISMWSGPMVWDFLEGPATLGLVPSAYRHKRLDELCRAAVFTRQIGVPEMNTHAGFIPEQPNDALYREFIPALRQLAKTCASLGIGLNLETGQETPITLRRAIEDVGLDNVGVNFDPANLIMYGKANPVDALSILGKYVRGVHAKDGDYPTNPSKLGEERALGQGSVDFPALVQGLKAAGYDGPLTIEREISGPEQKRDVQAANALLTKLL